MSGLDDRRPDPKRESEGSTGAPPPENSTIIMGLKFERGDEEGSKDGAAKDASVPKAEKSPRLREPKHHRVVRVGAGTRRRAITAAGVMLVVASALGAYTAIGVFGQIGQTLPASIPNTPKPIAGPITDRADNLPLEGVTVKIIGAAANENVSNAEGWYFLAPVVPGSYTLEASKAGFTTVRKTILVSPGIDRLEPFVMTHGGGVDEFPPEKVGDYQDPSGPQLALAIAILLASVLSAIGGWSAITHRHYLTAVAGAAGGTATVGLIAGLPLGSLLAIAALAILASLKTGFLEAQTHRIPWERRSPTNRRSRGRSR